MITIQQLQELKEIEDYNPLEKAIHTICIVDKKNIDKVESMMVYELFARFNTIVKEIEPRENLKFTFKLKGRRFKMIPNATEMQGQHFISLQQYSGDEIVNNLHKIMAMLTTEVNIFGRPKKIKNIAKHFEDVSELFLQLPFDIANTYSLFFSQLYPKLLESTQDFLIAKVKEMEHEAIQFKAGLKS
jgi:hypothetical protein